MGKVILQISYDIAPTQRESFLALAKEMKSHFAVERAKDYLIFEVKGKPNSFVEQFTCNSMEEYEALEDGSTEAGEALVNRLAGLLKDGKSKYASLVEVA